MTETRKPDPGRTREDILVVASDEFAEKGLSGARVDAIAARTKTTKRMIYYYFGSKEGLYLAVLERAYADIRAAEKTLDLDSLAPPEAMRRLIAATLEYQDAHPSFIRLVSIENIHHGRYLKDSETIRNLNVSVIQAMTAIIARGLADGSFTTTLDEVDLHMLISSVCFFRVANRYTFGTLFQTDLSAPETKARHTQMLGDAVLGLLGYRDTSEAKCASIRAASGVRPVNSRNASTA